MALKLKSSTNELRKGWNLAWYHHFTHIAVQKSWEGYGKNWMHFVYKLDNLFQNIRVSNENSSVTKALHFLKLPTTPYLLCLQYAPFKATSWTFNPLWHNLLCLMHLLICFELNGPAIEKLYKWTLKRLKLGMVSLFHPHSMCKKKRGSWQKLDALRVQTGQSVSKYQGFGRILISYIGNSKF